VKVEIEGAALMPNTSNRTLHLLRRIRCVLGDVRYALKYDEQREMRWEIEAVAVKKRYCHQELS
jgi:hypothetical protein